MATLYFEKGNHYLLCTTERQSLFESHRRRRWFTYIEIIESSSCLARDEYTPYHYSYSLYHNFDGEFRGNPVTAGQRVKINYGIPFTYDGSQGYISYYQARMDDGATLPDNALVDSVNWRTNETAQYTAHVAPGMLTKKTRNIVTLTSLQGQNLFYYGDHPSPEIDDAYWLINIDANNDFLITGVREVIDGQVVISDTYDHDQDPSTPPVAVEALIDLGTTTNFIFFWNVNFTRLYIYTHDVQTAPTERTAIFTTSKRTSIGNTDLFPAGTSSITLYCYTLCPIGGLTNSDTENTPPSQDLHHRYIFDATPLTYSLVLENHKLILVDDSNSLAVDISTHTTNYILEAHDLLTEPLAAPATANDLENAPVVYEWLTNRDISYQTVTLTDDAGDLVVFGDPIEIDYTYDAAHDVTNTDTDTNPYHGNTFSLTYGNVLWGLPITVFPDGTYKSEVNLVDGTPMSNFEGDYVVRSMYKLLSLNSVDLSECSALDIESLLLDDSLSLMDTEDIVDVSITVADKPDLNPAP